MKNRRPVRKTAQRRRTGNALEQVATGLYRQGIAVVEPGGNVRIATYAEILTLIGAGKVDGPAASADGEIALFDGSTGKLLKRATGTGVVHAASGVYSVSNVVESEITLADNTTDDVNTARHGFAPKAPNDATKYLDGTGAWSVPAGSGGGSGGSSGNGGHLHQLFRSLGDGSTTTFELLDFAEYLLLFAVDGLIVDPATLTLSADRTQITFSVAPGAGKVIAGDYVVATV